MLGQVIEKLHLISNSFKKSVVKSFCLFDFTSLFSWILPKLGKQSLDWWLQIIQTHIVIIDGDKWYTYELKTI